MLAEEVKLIAEREFNVFWPVLHQWCPESLMMSVVILHQSYGERLVCLSVYFIKIILFQLKLVQVYQILLHLSFVVEMQRPFLKQLSSLSEDVRSVLPSAEMLDHYLTQLHSTALEANRLLLSSCQVLDHYQVSSRFHFFDVLLVVNHTDVGQVQRSMHFPTDAFIMGKFEAMKEFYVQICRKLEIRVKCLIVLIRVRKGEKLLAAWML